MVGQSGSLSLLLAPAAAGPQTDRGTDDSPDTLASSPADVPRIALRAPHVWRGRHGEYFGLLIAPGAMDPLALERWMWAGCPDPSPARQEFVLVRVSPDGSDVTAVVGARPGLSVVWSQLEGQLILGTSFREVVESLGPRPPLDVGYMASLVVGVDDGVRTPATGVLRVKPGEQARWRSGNQPRITRWFRPEETPVETSPETEVDQMRTCIFEAVAATLDRESDVAATVSGGLDSTMVAAVAARILHPLGHRVRGLTHVPLPGTPDPRPGYDADDGPFATLMADSTPGLDVELLANTERLLTIDLVPQIFEETLLPPVNTQNAVWLRQLAHRARELGLTQVLTGQSGNATFSYTTPFLGETLLRQGRAVQAWREIRTRASRSGRRRLLSDPGALWNLKVLTSGQLPQLASLELEGGETPVQAWVRQHYGRMESLEPEYLERLKEMLSRPLPSGPPRLNARGGSPTRVMVMQPDALGLWWSDPLADPEVVRLATWLPLAAWNRGGFDRSIGRRSGVGLVPTEISWRPRRGAQAAGWSMIARERRGPEPSEILCRVGVIDLERFRAWATAASSSHDRDQRVVDWHTALDLAQFSAIWARATD